MFKYDRHPAALTLVGTAAEMQAAEAPGPVCTEPASDDVFDIVHALPGRIRVRVQKLLTDPGCTTGLVNGVLALQGVESARVNAWCACVIVTFDPQLVSQADVLSALVRSEALPERPSNGTSHWWDRLSALFRIWLRALDRVAPPVVQFAAGLLTLGSCLLGAPPIWARCLTVVATAPIIGRAARTALDEKRLCVDGLDGLAAVLMIAQGKTTAASFMIALIGLGEYIRELTANSCKKMIGDLLGLAGRSAWVVRGRKRICLAADEVKVGDVVVVYAGEMVPVDGTVLSGEAAVNRASLTGESQPVEVQRDDCVYAGSVVTEGKIYVRCMSTGRNSRAGLLIELIENSPLSETRMQNYTAQVADKLVVPILVGAAASFGLTRQLSRAMSVLIFDFSTGIRISAPTAVLASMHRAGRHGILVKSGAALEKLAAVNAVVFDKTGTLTLGEPRVTEVIALDGLPPDRLAALAAAVEERSRHPAARAIVRYAHKQNLCIPERVGSNNRLGLGASAIVEGLPVLVGSRRLMLSEGIDVRIADRKEADIVARGESIAYLAIGGKLHGIVAYSDRLRPETAQVIPMLKVRGVNTIVMATGDHEGPAQAAARLAGIDTVVAGAFPEQKVELVRSLKKQGKTVAVVGDGINDSPALAHADIGISLHGGTDAAREHADVVLTDDDLRRLPEAIDIARSAMTLVKENIAFISVSNGVGLFLAASGAIGPAMSTLLNNGSAIAAALNSLRPLFSDEWSRAEDDALPGGLRST